MAEDWPHTIVSAMIKAPHGFLTGPQSDGGQFSRATGDFPLVSVNQVHSAHAIVVTAPFADKDRPQADAMVTDRPGLALAIRTADCAPVLLADEAAGVIGAAHAGWRGALGGVLENTIAAMEKLGAQAERIAAAIGPAIARESYEVDEHLRSQFAEGDARFFAAGRPGHYQFDLPGYVAWRLSVAGIGMVDSLSIDTYADDARFHSFRRATHRGEPTYGRQYSLIGKR